jgi:chemotaxis signal transduction protein
VAGIINHRGAIFTLIDFARLSGLGQDRAGAVVLLRLPDMAVGLAVASVEGLERIDGGPKPPAPAGDRVPLASFLRRARDSAGRPVLAIDADQLADAISRIPERARPGESTRSRGGGATSTAAR